MPTENEQNWGTIAVSEAVRITTNWRTWLADPTGQLSKKAFLIPIGNITDLLTKNLDIDGIRCYLTLDDPEDPSTMNMVIVPVKDDVDLVRLPSSSLTEGEGEGGDEDDSNVYNFSVPCPPYCDDDSELNGGGQP